MTAIGVYGGFGSSVNQIELVAKTIGEKLQKRAIGMNFREASQDLGAMAESMDKKTVYLHSAGFMLAAKAIELCGGKYRPERIVAIAPPIPEQVRRLMGRGILIEAGMRYSQTDELEHKLTTKEHELRRHFWANCKELRNIADFDALEAAAALKEKDYDISVAIMNSDGLFDYTTDTVQTSILEAEAAQVPVIGLEGRHTTFTHSPSGIVDEIERGVSFRDVGCDNSRIRQVNVSSVAAAAIGSLRQVRELDLRRRLTV